MKPLETGMRWVAGDDAFRAYAPNRMELCSVWLHNQGRTFNVYLDDVGYFDGSKSEVRAYCTDKSRAESLVVAWCEANGIAYVWDGGPFGPRASALGCEGPFCNQLNADTAHAGENLPWVPNGGVTHDIPKLIERIRELEGQLAAVRRGVPTSRALKVIGEHQDWIAGEALAIRHKVGNLPEILDVVHAIHGMLVKAEAARNKHRRKPTDLR